MGCAVIRAFNHTTSWNIYEFNFFAVFIHNCLPLYILSVLLSQSFCVAIFL
ncbi:MAG: hypothetical protein JWN01_486 [Patescibacteria group bacterium]|nr:hypothetical protein [Patescibacteria group bacterium]